MAPALWLFISLFPRNIFPYRAMAIFPENVPPIHLCIYPEYIPIPGMAFFPENVLPIHLCVSPEYLPILGHGNLA
jgi:hypothetical protein